MRLFVTSVAGGGYLYSGKSSPSGTVTLLVKAKVVDPATSAL